MLMLLKINLLLLLLQAVAAGGEMLLRSVVPLAVICLIPQKNICLQCKGGAVPCIGFFSVSL